MEDKGILSKIEPGKQFLKTYEAFLVKEFDPILQNLEKQHCARLRELAVLLEKVDPCTLDGLRMECHRIFSANFSFQSFNPKHTILLFWAGNLECADSLPAFYSLPFDAEDIQSGETKSFLSEATALYRSLSERLSQMMKSTSTTTDSVDRVLPIKNVALTEMVLPLFEMLIQCVDQEFLRQFDEIQSICSEIDRLFPNEIPSSSLLNADEDEEIDKAEEETEGATLPEEQTPLDCFEARGNLVQFVRELENKRSSEPLVVSFSSFFLEKKNEFEHELTELYTQEVRQSRFSDSRVRLFTDRCLETLDSDLKRWEKLYNSFYRYWIFQDQLAEQRMTLQEVFLDFIEDNSRTINQDLLPLNNAVIQFFETEIDSFQHLDSRFSFAQSREKREKIKTNFSKDLLPTLVGAIGKISDRKVFVELQTQVSEVINRFPYKIVLKQEAGNPDKAMKFVEFTPRELITYELEPLFESMLTKLKERVQNSIQELQKAVLNIDRMIDFSFDILSEGHEEGEIVGEDSLVVLRDSFERAKNQLVNLNQEFKEHEEETELQIMDIYKRFDQRLKSMGEVDQLFQIRLQVSQSKAKQKTITLKNQAKQWGMSFVPALQKQSKELLDSSSNKINPLLLKYKFMKNDETMDLNLASFLYETDQKLEQLPLVYKELFTLDPVVRFEYFSGREEEVESLERAYSRWKTGVPTSVALIGESGAGVSSLLNYFIEQADLKKKTKCITIDSPIVSPIELCSRFCQCLGLEGNSQSALEAFLCSDKSPRAVVVEGVDSFFLRQLKGFDALQWFIELMNATQAKVFWVISSHQFAWEYLKSTHRVTDNFSMIVPMAPLESKHLRSIIYARHEVSQYRIHWIATNGKAETSQKKQEEAYFAALQKVAKTNVSVALYYWLRSIQKIENHTLYLQPIENLNGVWLNNLNKTTLFLLYSVLLHNGITEEQLAQTVGVSSDVCRRELVWLRKNGIVLAREKRLEVNPLLYSSVTEYLSNQNIIH